MPLHLLDATVAGPGPVSSTVQTTLIGCNFNPLSKRIEGRENTYFCNIIGPQSPATKVSKWVECTSESTSVTSQERCIFLSQKIFYTRYIKTIISFPRGIWFICIISFSASTRDIEDRDRVRHNGGGAQRDRGRAAGDAVCRQCWRTHQVNTWTTIQKTREQAFIL